MVWIKFTLLSAGALCVLVACSKDTVGERGYRGALPPGCTGTTSAALGTDDAGDGDAAGASGGYERVVAVFQPHRYSRTQALWEEFGACFGDADLLVLTDIYPAGEEPRPGVTGRLLVDSTLAADPGRSLLWAPTLDDVVEQLVDVLAPGDLLMTVGAGDVTTVGPRVLERLTQERR